MTLATQVQLPFLVIFFFYPKYIFLICVLFHQNLWDIEANYYFAQRDLFLCAFINNEIKFSIFL